jgi:hypothetical protein
MLSSKTNACKELGFRHRPQQTESRMQLRGHQQFDNGAIVGKLIVGVPFFDGRACGSGSQEYVVKRDAHTPFDPHFIP